MIVKAVLFTLLPVTISTLMFDGVDAEHRVKWRSFVELETKQKLTTRAG